MNSSPEEGSGTGPSDAQTSSSSNGGSSSSSGKPPASGAKNDAEKEQQRAEEESQKARMALQKFGRKRFMDALWRLVAMDNPDSIMLRFLRARKWNPGAALAMMCTCVKWRIDYGVDAVVEKGEEQLDKEIPGFLKQFQDGKSYTQGTDRQGRPVTYINVALHKPSEQPQEALEKFIVMTMESVRCMLIPPREKVTICFNMKGFSMKNMDWNCLTFLIKCLEGYYPECLNCVLVHDAPWIVQGIWKMVAPMLDPVVRAKIQFTKNASELFVHIPETHLISDLGGKSTWKWEFVPPQAGENSQQQDTETKDKLLAERAKLVEDYEQVTQQWIKEPQDANVQAIRQVLSDVLRRNYFQLDAFRRGCTVYHRKGTLVGNGMVMFDYPPPKDTAQSTSEWEVIGQDFCIERLEVSTSERLAELQQKGVQIPSSLQALATPP